MPLQDPRAAELDARTLAMARTIAGRSAEAIASFKATAVALAQATLSPAAFERVHGLRRRVCVGRDYAEGGAAFVEKRRPVI